MSTRSRCGIAAALLALAAVLVSPAPVRADDSVGHRITFTVATAPAPCLVLADADTVVSPANPFEFEAARNVGSTVTSCSDEAQNLAVSGSAATNANGLVRWNLQDSASVLGPGCASSSPLNRYAVLAGNGPTANIILAATPRPLVDQLAPGASLTKAWSVRTACVGSTGSGEALSFTVTFLATLA